MDIRQSEIADSFGNYFETIQQINHLQNYKVGDWVRATKDLFIGMQDGKNRLVKKGAIGKIVKSTPNAIFFSNGDWLTQNSQAIEVIPEPDNISPAEKILLYSSPLTWTIAYNASLLRGKLVTPEQVYTTGKETVTEIADGLPSIFSGVKKYLIISIVILVIAFFIFK